MRIHHLAVIASLVVFSLSALPAAVDPAPPIACGDTLFGTAKLHVDLDCSGTGKNPALTLAPGARLDMSRHTVTCNDPNSDGVAMPFQFSKLQVGTVAGCKRAAVLGGAGGHFVGTMTVKDSATAFAVLSSGNRLQLNHSLDNGVGISVSGNGNALISNHISGGTTGIEVTSDNNLVKSNIVDGADVGIAISGDANRVLANRTPDNGTGVHLVAPATLNEIRQHTALDNSIAGIEVASGATGNTIAGSIWRDNGTDLIDDNPHNTTACANIWQRNTTPTTTVSGASATCIK